MGRKKSFTVEDLDVLDLADEGKSIAKKEGLVYIAEGGVPGDNVDLLVTSKKKNFYLGKVTKYNSLSKKRVIPFCNHFGTCGGCKWQNLNYTNQCYYKEKNVENTLGRIGKIDTSGIKSIIPSDSQKHYRNKLEFTFTNSKWLTAEEIENSEKIDRRGVGFHLSGRYDRVLDVDTCYLQADISNKIRNELKNFMIKNDLTAYDQKLKQGFLRNVIIRTAESGQLMVIVQFGEDNKNNIKKTLAHLHQEIPSITSLQYVVNPKLNDSYQDLEIKLFSGKPYIEEKIDHVTFRIGSKSFFQTNTKQTVKLYNVIKEFAQVKEDEVVFDLYSGIGSIGLFLANQAKEVLGFEYISEAVEDAEVNAQINSIENARFFAGDIKDMILQEKLSSLISENCKPDVVITDPPRAGMHKNVINSLLDLKPSRIVYVSCNPATQARDIELLSPAYKVTQIQPVDMFPHTHHVENVVLLELI